METCLCVCVCVCEGDGEHGAVKVGQITPQQAYKQ